MKKISIKVINKDGSTSLVEGYAINQDVVPDQFAVHKVEPAYPEQAGFFYHVTHLPSGAFRAFKADTYKAAIAEFIEELTENRDTYQQIISNQKIIQPIQTSLF